MGGLETLLLSMSQAKVRVHAEGRLGVGALPTIPLTRSRAQVQGRV